MGELSDLERQEQSDELRQHAATGAVELAVTLTEGDVAGALRFYHRRRGTRWIVTAVVLWFTLMSLQSLGLVPALLYAAVAWPLLSAVLTWAVDTGARRRFRAEPNLHHTVRLRITDEGLESSSELGESRLKWGAFRAAWRTDRVYLLFPQKQLFLIVPRRVFATPEEEQRFEDILTCHVPCSWVPQHRANPD